MERESKQAAETIRRFILENFYVEDAQQLAEDTSLLDTGLVDSTGIIEIISFIETEFAIKVDDEEMTPENLDGIGRITAFVSRKREAAAGRVPAPLSTAQGA